MAAMVSSTADLSAIAACILSDWSTRIMGKVLLDLDFIGSDELCQAFRRKVMG